MKIKLSRSQFFSLLQIYQLVCSAKTPENFEARLIMVILDLTKKQLIRKSVDIKKKYSVTLSDIEALAFFIFFKKFHIFPEGSIYEATLVNTICNQVHHHFSNPI